ncbi:hypothetical protein [Clostridium formicaceticum]|uniref:hypothetical protein n=1 Tax=Clostridium formicaceticum TaxID=1497 RepID=UPI0012EA205E|nr:hypothetical protein [Clostridium formicaceticum]
MVECSYSIIEGFVLTKIRRYSFDDKQDRLQVVGDGLLFEESVNTNNLTNAFIALLEEQEVL